MAADGHSIGKPESCLPSTTGYSPILPANITGRRFSKMKIGNGGPAISVVPRCGLRSASSNLMNG
jgi:hypothetical protein